MKTIGCISLGCDKNTTDSEAMLGFLLTKGYRLESPENANIILVNTCAFIDAAMAEAAVEIQKAIAYKLMGNATLVIVAGCLVERKKEALFAQFPQLDGIIDTRNIHHIDKLLEGLLFPEKTEDQEPQKKYLHDPQKNASTGASTGVPSDFFHHRVLSTPKHYAYLKIAEGCDNHCTYCIIPDLRGMYRSKPMESLLSEASILAARGVKELILVAQDTAPYGKDLYGSSKLHELLQKLSPLSFTWIRVLYSYPEHLTEATILEIKNNPKICKYLDIPVQHGSNRLLKRMNRQVTQENLYKLIDNLRSKIPGITLRTSIIVGFPGETETDITILKEFLQKASFDKLGVFPYSREVGTVAYAMEDQIEETEKTSRMEAVMLLQSDISAKKLALKKGTIMDVLIDGYDNEENMYIGRSQSETPEVDGNIFFTAEKSLEIGSLVPVYIEAANPYDLIGVLYESTE